MDTTFLKQQLEKLVRRLNQSLQAALRLKGETLERAGLGKQMEIVNTNSSLNRDQGSLSHQGSLDTQPFLNASWKIVPHNFESSSKNVGCFAS